MDGLGGKKIGGEVARGALGCVGIASLASLAVFELGVRGEEALVVGWAAKGFLASGLVALVLGVDLSRTNRTHGIKSWPVGCRHIFG